MQAFACKKNTCHGLLYSPWQTKVCQQAGLGGQHAVLAAPSLGGGGVGRKLVTSSYRTTAICQRLRGRIEPRRPAKRAVEHGHDVCSADSSLTMFCTSSAGIVQLPVSSSTRTVEPAGHALTTSHAKDLQVLVHAFAGSGPFSLPQASSLISSKSAFSQTVCEILSGLAKLLLTTLVAF